MLKKCNKKNCLPLQGSNLWPSVEGAFTEATSSLSEKKTQQLEIAPFGAQHFYASRFLLREIFQNNLCHLIADIIYYLSPSEQAISKNGATLTYMLYIYQTSIFAFSQAKFTYYIGCSLLKPNEKPSSFFLKPGI